MKVEIEIGNTSPLEIENGAPSLNLVLKDLEVIPSKEEQIFNHIDSNGYDEVKIKGIPEEYIIPEGESNITKNGSYDVTSKSKVNVDVKSVEINDASYLFYYGSRLEKKDEIISLLKNITKTSYMYANSGLTEIDLSHLDTSQVTAMTCMFQFCSGLTEIDLSHLDTSQVISISDMFAWCSGLTEIDLSMWNTENLANMSSLFTQCEKLKSVNLENINTSKVKTMMNIFDSCKNLTTLDLTNFDTSSLENLSGSFRNCSKLTSLDISTWDLSKINVISSMFSSDSKLTNLKFGKNLGKGYNRNYSNYSSFTLDLSSCKLLTHESLMSVIDGLYDLNIKYNVANGGTLYTQKLVLGSTNLAKLTEEEKAIASNKGWVLS